ncbi:amino acid adenylation domain-containing protein [Fibrobacter sp.]|uniref:amino acid adenylation domain-containing protein n=1 Tax=Fibrobacter sp. TaxID=35828 RepID=UPI00388DB22F
MQKLIERFIAVVKKNANDIAVVDCNGTRKTTYEELNAMRRRVAGKLKTFDFAPGTPVLILMDRNVEYVASYLGILSAGLACVQLSLEYPQERIDYIKGNCGSPLIVTDDFWSDLDNYEPWDGMDVPDDCTACIVYTSGSTGMPKGVVHPWKSIVRFVFSMDMFPDVNAREVFAMNSSFAFVAFTDYVSKSLTLGFEFHIVPDHVVKNGEKLVRYFLEHKVSITFLTPSYLKRLNLDSTYLKTVICGGELLSDFYSEKFQIVNAFGCSETGPVCCFKVNKPYRTTPIGKPFKNCEFVLADENGKVNDSLTEGELCVITHCATEYIGLLEKSKSTFVQMPDGRILYHTGDVMRRCEDGNYVYVSRKDWMVKVNGQRVETLEVENVIKEIEGVENVAVKAFVDEDGQNYIVAYFVNKSGAEEISEVQIRRELAKKVPPYMIPRFFVNMKALPLTVTGKLDRVSLEQPSVENYKVEYRAPANDAEKAVCEAISAVLNCGRVGADDDFFALGGESIKVLKLMDALKNAGFSVSAKDILQAKVVSKIAASAKCVEIPSDCGSVLNVAAKPLSSATQTAEDYWKRIPEITPLTESQRGVYFESIEKPLSTMYNIPFALELPASIDVEKFENAVKSVALMHPALFVTVSDEMGEPAMFFHVPECVVEHTEALSKDAALARFVRPFDLANGSLYRFEICKVGDSSLFLADIHHIVFDGSSMKVLLGQIADVYAGGSAVAESFTQFDASRNEFGLKISRAYKAAQEFFKGEFEGFEWEEMLIPDKAGNPGEMSSDIVVTKADADLSTRAVEHFVRKNGVTESSLFLAAFAYALSKFSGTDESNFITVNNGRHDDGLMDTVGMFVRTIPLRFDIPDGKAVAEFLQDVQNKLFDSMEHDCISFGELMENYGVRFDVSFVYQSDLLSEVKLGDALVMPEELKVNDCQANLIGMLLKTENGYEMHTHFKNSLYFREFIENLNETVLEIAKGMLACERLDEIQVVSTDARHFIDNFNNTDLPKAKFQTVNEVFEAVVKKAPEKTALVFKENHYTFAELDRLTRNLAAFVNGKKIGKDDFVAVLVPRSDNMVIAAWGVVCAGAAFQPLDPTYPAERLNYMVQDSRAKLLIADRNLVGLVNEYKGDVLFVDEIAGLPDAPDFCVMPNPEDALTMIYTSGTTGKPKGCVLENRNLAAFFRNHCQIMEMDENTRFASYASFGFDAGVMDVVTVPMAGGTLYVVPDEIRLDLDKLNEFFCENEITHGFMTTQLGRMFASETKCETLKAFQVGGEKLVPFNPPKNFRFVNGYGPCETMAYICHHDVCDNSPIQPIGVPSGDTKLYVCDKFGRMLPAGAVGELCIAGAQVGRGYLGLPEKTSSVFVENPFTKNAKYARMYKTGDVVRLLPQGEIEFIGRRDGQVKVRGFRIELTEVEEVIRRFEGIKDATVTAFDDPAGGKFLAAYVVSDSKVDVQKLNDFICGEKPAYMLPAATMQIPAIPYNQNQKVNRRALPEPKRGNSGDNAKAETEAQRKIFEIAAGILGHDNFGVDTNLFYAGLTSISTLKFNLALSKAFGKPMKITDVKENNTVRMLEKFLGLGASNGGADFAGVNVAGNNGAGVVAGAAAREKRSSYPLMQNQMGVFVESQMNKDSVDYNIPTLFRISTKLSLEKLKAAVEKTIDAHPYIKATLSTDKDGNICAVRNDDTPAVAEIVEVAEIPEGADLCAYLVKPFTLIGSPLYRIKIFKTQKGNFLFMDVHHIVSDGTSLGILLNDINRAYAGEALEAEFYTGFDAALEEVDLRASDKFTAAEEYYGKLLSSCNTESLPAKCPERSATDSGAPVAHFHTSFGDCSAPVTEFCKKHNVTQNAFFNAAFCFTLSKFIHNESVAYCTVYNGRNDSRLFESVAMLVKTLPVSCDIVQKGTVLSLVELVQNQLMDSMANDIYSFAEVSKKSGLKSDIFFTYQGDNFNFDNIGGEAAEMVALDMDAAKAPVTFEVGLTDGVYHLDVTYRTDYFCNDFMESFAGALAQVAESFTRCETLDCVTLMTAEERKKFDEMNVTDTPFENVPPQRFLEQWAAKTPDKVAIEDLTGSLTYAELNAKANSVANALVARGVRADDIIGMIIERTINVPVLEFGILKSGGAFLPMLPTYPDDRIDFCLQNADCKFVIATRDIVEKRKNLFSEDKPYKALVLEDLIAEGDTDLPKVDFSPNQLAYCIYTSGSTGVPKGVMIEHHSISNFVQTNPFKQIMDVAEKLLCISSISFDMSLIEAFYALCRGKTAYIAADEEIHDIEKLCNAFIQNNVDAVVMTPSFASSLLSVSEFEKVVTNLKGFLLGAEAFPPTLYSKLKSLNPDLLVQNGYGPTECTVACAFKILSSAENITIGGPSSNTKFYVMDDCGQLLPRYAVGELMICGECVGRGYVKLPEKTAAAFVEVDGFRAYHSGDLVRINRDGEVEFGGRADNQVKLRGFRVELDEIESVMQQFEGVTQAKVIVRNNGTEDFLAGFFIANKQISLEELTAFLKKKLTYYMVPAAMMQLEKMPMTANGKLDKKALPEIRPVAKARKKRVPKKSLEQSVLEIFQSALHVDECYSDDNFFEIGGTSLAASKVVMQLKSAGYKIEYQDIFDHQTAEELAEYLESLGGAGSNAVGGNSAAAISAEGVSEPGFIKTAPEIAEVLKCNSMEFAAETERKPLGTVVLTGATGFLGVHVLKELLELETGRIYCLMRKGHFDDPVERLKTTLVYYFEDDFAEAFKNRITVVEGDITDEKLPEIFKEIAFDTLINCAACVKHYANDSSIEFVNVHGVENLIALCKAHNAKIIQISTTSVPGVHNDDTYKVNLRMPENQLFVVDDMNNQYGQSKYKAELLVFNAIREGVRGKVLRAGNLMGRASDGEFQTNAHTNAFLNALRGFVAIGKSPISHSTDPMSFSPIDSTAKAMVLLAGTNDKFTAFNVDSRWTIDEMKLIDVVNQCGLKITPVDDKEYYDDFYRMMSDPAMNEKVSALLTNDRPDLHVVNTDNRFTANVLYRLGFAWPFVDDAYLERVIKSLDTLDFFA